MVLEHENILKIKSIPVLILSAKGEEYDKLYGFSLGIEDYVMKPFSPKELMARLGVITRRNNKDRFGRGVSGKDKLSFEGLVIDGDGYNVYIDGEKAIMTLREFDVLYFLARNPNIVFHQGTAF